MIEGVAVIRNTLPTCCVMHKPLFSSHGISLDFSDFIHPELSIDTYRRTYSNMIHPIPHQSSWEDVLGEVVLPPSFTYKTGRTKKIRVREEGKAVAGQRRWSVRCANCLLLGNNKRSCKNPQARRPKKVFCFMLFNIILHISFVL